MSIMENIWAMLGYPRKPQPHQVGEAIVTQREDRDCLVVAVANACKISYEKAHGAVHHADLPFFFESPIMSNHWNAFRTLESLGKNTRELGEIDDLLRPDYQQYAGRILLLLHDPTSTVSSIVNQHWVVWNGYFPEMERHALLWGNSQLEKLKKHPTLEKMFTAGWPDCGIIIEWKEHGK